MINKIVNQTRETIREAKRMIPLKAIMSEATQGDFAFSATISRHDWSLIAECKLASPAKGTLCSSHTVVELAKIYANSGATALSVHTNAAFGGRMADIVEVKKAVDVPVLCKEFIIDEYQLVAARAAGADAVLLIAALLSNTELTRFSQIAGELGMDSLVEVHTLHELKRVQQTEAKIVGINNRDLRSFTTNIEQTFALLPYCDQGRLIISESGIRNEQDAGKLKRAGVNGILVGEALVTAGDVSAKTIELALGQKRQEGEIVNA